MRLRIVACSLVCMTLLSLGAYAMGGKEGRRNVRRDVERAAESRLSDEQYGIARFVMTFYCVRFGYKAAEESFDTDVASLTKEQYGLAVKQAAAVAVHPMAGEFIKAGKAGEKLLKALIVTLEEGATATKEWVDAQSGKYDSKKP